MVNSPFGLKGQLVAEMKAQDAAVDQLPVSLWTGQEILAATGGSLAGSPPASDAGAGWDVGGISIDSRTVQKGDLFVALAGERFDGHDHAARAIASGAGAALVSRMVDSVSPAVMVGDTLVGLQKLAIAARPRIREEVFAVTGSAGKTTTKEMLKAVLAAQGTVHATEGNLNNHIGLPLMLARTPRDVQFGVFELGMSFHNEIDPLSRMLQPDVAVITNVGTAHIQNFEDGARGIAKAKGEIFAGLTEDGIVVLPRDSEHYPFLLKLAQARGIEEIFSFGSHREADGRLVSVEDDGTVRAEIFGEGVSYKLNLPGRHMAMNALSVLLAVSAVGLDMKLAVKALGEMQPIKGRGVHRDIGGVELVDESYNANPQSMSAAIQVLGEMKPKGRRIVALGEMLELGRESEPAHAALLEDLADAHVGLVFCCGAGMKPLWDRLPDFMRGAWVETSEQLAPLVAACVTAGDAVLVKGSRGKQYKINGVISPSMALVIAAIEQEKTGKEMVVDVV